MPSSNISITLAIFLLCSCSLSTTKGLTEIPLPLPPQGNNNYFTHGALDYVYKAKITINKNHFGGLLIIKKIDASEYRFVLATNFGHTLIDLSQKKQGFVVNSVIPEFNKKNMLKVLQRDLGLLVRPKFTINANYTNSKQDTIYKNGMGKNQYYYYYRSGRLQRIVGTNRFKEKLVISFSEQSDSLANKITIDHKNSLKPIQIALNRIE